MKICLRYLSFSGVMFLVGYKTLAQELINGNMETWIDNSAYTYPEGWATLNELRPEYGWPFTVFRTSDAAEGQSAAMLKTGTFVNFDGRKDTIPSYMVYGSSYSSGVHYPWTKRLKSISFMYKFIPAGFDTGMFYVNIGYRDRKQNKMITEGGVSLLIVNPQATYKRVTIPISYFYGYPADTLVMVFVNSIRRVGGNKPKPGTLLYLDDFKTEWDNFPLTVNIMAEKPWGIYPNPADDLLFFEGQEIQNSRISINDISGKLVLQGELNQSALNVSGLLPGCYLIHLTSHDGAFLGNRLFYKK